MFFQKGGTMPNRGFIFDLMDEISNAPIIHQRLIKKFEERFNTNLICYTALFGHPAGAITYQDSELIENILRSIELKDKNTHGRYISPDEAKAFGLNIKKEDKYGEFWNMIWEIYVRIENYTRNKRLAKYLLSRNGGIDVQAMPMGI